MKKHITFFVAAISIFSCSPEPEQYRKIHSMAYVADYYNYEEIKLNVSPYDDYFEIAVVPLNKYGITSSTTPKYLQKCNTYGDTGYDHYYYEYLLGPRLKVPTYQDRDFTRIEIRSDAGYDAAHPAGSLLNDLFYFSSMSPIKFIRNGYVNPYDWTTSSLPDYYENFENRAGVQFSVPVYGLLSELGPEDWVLLGGNNPGRSTTLAAFTPVGPPEGEKVHNFTLTLTDTEDKVLTASVRFEFP